MSILTLCLSFIVFVQAEDEKNLITAACLFLKLFASFKSTINFINLANMNKIVIDDILKEVSSELQYAVEITNESTKATSMELKFCNVIIADKLEAVDDFLEKFSSEVYDARGYYLVITMKSFGFEDVSKLFEQVWKVKIFNLNIIHEEEKEIFSTQFEFFTKNYCAGKFAHKSFLTKKLTMETSELYANKRNDMHGCPVKVSTFGLSPFVMKKDTMLLGRDIELIKTISEALRFTLVFDYIEGNIPWGYLFENGTGTGAIAKLMNNETDVILGDYFLKLDRLKYFDSSEPYFSSQLVFIIPPPDKFSAFQKLSQPFELNVWASLIACYLVGIIFILLANRMSTKFRKLVFGSVNSTPITNMISITLGLTQTVIPSCGLSRFLFILFIMFCMVMRTIYQGSLYRFLQSDGTVKGVKSFDDLIEKNFKFYIGKSFEELIHEHSELSQRKAVVSGSLSPTFKLFNNPSIQATFIVPLPNILLMNQRQTYNFSFNVLKHETFATLSVVMYYQKKFYLAEAINDAIQKLQSAGLIEYWHYSYYAKTKIKVQAEKRMQFNINHLLGAYEVWGGGCFVSFVVFIAEIFMKRMTSRTFYCFNN